MEIKKGDVVTLKSGSPPMTVCLIYEGIITCDWFDGTENKRAYFTPEQLIITENPSSN